MKHKIAMGMVFVAGALAAGSTLAAMKMGSGRVPFWVEISSPQQIDMQVAKLIGDRAASITVRIPEGPIAPILAAVAELRKAAPGTPILRYGRASRNLGKHGADVSLDWVGQNGGQGYVRAKNGKVLAGFGDVTQPEYRSWKAQQLAAMAKQGGFDGVALDLSIRTPRYRPGPLARLCKMEAGYCERYAAGMDATFDAIHAALDGRWIMYNGLWNMGPGSVADQQVLLDHADAAAIEYFGTDPKFPQHSFSHDIQPFLDAMAKASPENRIMAYGRGIWTYVDYAEDYQWQRYLYCSYLLGARNNTYFKYHATFQGDTTHGRTGGLSVYADWAANLGAATGSYTTASGIYSRAFARGLVVVAPDEGSGGTYTLKSPMYSPEGEKYEGSVSLKAGQGLLLLTNKSVQSDSQSLLDLKLLADWPDTRISGQGSETVASMGAGSPEGTHDMLLDVVRTLHPHNELQLATQALGKSTVVQVVAEVDDPKQKTEFAVVELRADGSRPANRTLSIGFRSSLVRKKDLPVIAGPRLTTDAWQSLKLDGRALFADSGLTFRRWDNVRFVGAIKLKAIALK